MLIAIDIETKAKPEYSHVEDAALHPHMAEIAVIGAVCKRFELTFRGPTAAKDLVQWILNWEQKVELVGHNFKFDLKHLIHALGANSSEAHELSSRWEHDTMLMAYLFPDKVTDRFLADYEDARHKANGNLPRGYSHRKGGALSLKTLAPYFLGVDPFWEDPTNHDSDEYVLKDTRYTLELCKKFLGEFERFPAHYKFYKEKQLPWTRTLLRAEVEGVAIDRAQLAHEERSHELQLASVEQELRSNWAKAQTTYEHEQRNKIAAEYTVMEHAALEKLEKVELDENFKEIRNLDKAKASRVRIRYRDLRDRALGAQDYSLNLSSPKQLQWLLRDYLGYDITNYSGKESTDKEVLQKLAHEGKEDVKLLLEHRRLSKLVTSYFPKYKELLTDSSRIHASFNPAGTRTGRLSSNSPNLQQCPAALHKLFIADPGYVFVTKDLSAVEPAMIAYFTGDPKLTEIVREGLSFHSINAKALFDLDCTVDAVADRFAEYRKAAKELGLAGLYGAGARRCKIALEKRGFKFTEAECKVFVKRLRETYQVVWDFKRDLDALLEQGETVYNLMGRPIRFFDPDEVYMKGFNRLVQGSASDWLQEAALQINEQLEGASVRLLVHDELVVQVPEARAYEYEKRIEEIMTSVDLGAIKLKVEGGVSKTWVK